MLKHGARAEASLDILIEGTRPTAARGPSPKLDNRSNDQLANTRLIRLDRLNRISNIESNQTRASI
ncbi:uncharacterized protein K441DRAFT_650143 [Cenococcum geophilum 1.58]|uniref:uncharacterized protein n=1 Tax=Cenococcum geophilum 1.58 TaxID=794803 RepID=UPI00358EF439|nr:hypothetical protein K441DRAFT_650143 [Cenococcum geophilum 1.58]